MDADHLAVGRHYDDVALAYELERLERRSPVERAMMERYLARFVPDGAVVADVGAGAGHYDELLARRGCRLHLADVSRSLLAAAQERLRSCGLAGQVLTAEVASATDLGHLDAGGCDAVLLLGPLYHLLTLAERRRAVREAWRILRPGGVLLAAGCNRLVGLSSGYYLEPEDGLKNRDAYRQFLSDGIVDPEMAPTLGHAHFTTVAEFRALFDGEFDELTYVGVESLTATRQELYLELSPEVQEAWLDVVEATAATPEGIAVSEHLLFVGRRPEEAER